MKVRTHAESGERRATAHRSAPALLRSVRCNSSVAFADPLQYLPLRDLDTVTNALNFSTPDLHVIGGCDIYTTKAAGSDKKLYKNIESSLESQYESLVRLSASLSPPYRTASEDGKGSDASNGGRKKRSRTADIPEIDLSRASPFGPLSQITARRTFAYLIATLNASHPDYDFSHLLRPADFRKERSLRAIMQNVDSTLQNLRPKQNMAANFLAPPAAAHVATSEVWSARMWSLIDQEMGLRQCEKYSYAPDDDPFDGEEGAIWSLHYFFFNKERKRVCYFYLRGLSVISHSPVSAPGHVQHWRPRLIQRKASSVSVGEGAGKRASYWLGARANDSEIDTDAYADDDDDEMVLADPEDDEVERASGMDLDDIRFELTEGYWGMDGTVDQDQRRQYAGGWPVEGPRGVSEEIGESMEL